MKRVLVVDDERRGRRVLQILIEKLGMESIAAENGAEALRRFQEERVDLVLTDLRMPEMTGMELLKEVKQLDPDVPVIVLTAYATVQTAVEAMKLGAFDYILRPFDIDAVEASIRRALELRTYRAENRFLKEQVRARLDSDTLAPTSRPMAEILALIEKIAPTKSAALITGETGTGKELAARTIHERSPRAGKLFVPLNCAAIPGDLLESELFGHARGAFTGAAQERVGKFELADGGTLLLDEIGDMTQALQAKLLRVLQEGVVEPVGSNKRVKVDVRILSSTNRDLAADIEAGRFRQDLYYRLNVFHIHLPPLRERLDDVPALAALFLEKFARELGRPTPQLDGEAERLLREYTWPGNVRELRNLMERAAVLCTEGGIDGRFVRSLLPAVSEAAEAEPSDLSLESAVERVERRLILRALGETGDNKTQAARLLGVSERTLWYKLSKYGL